MRCSDYSARHLSYYKRFEIKSTAVHACGKAGYSGADDDNIPGSLFGNHGKSIAKKNSFDFSTIPSYAPSGMSNKHTNTQHGLTTMNLTRPKSKLRERRNKEKASLRRAEWIKSLQSSSLQG